MPWTTMAVAISMGCNEEERSAIMDGLELRPKSEVHGAYWEHKVRRAENEENTLAARIRRRDRAKTKGMDPERVIHDSAPKHRTTHKRLQSAKVTQGSYPSCLPEPYPSPISHTHAFVSSSDRKKEHF